MEADVPAANRTPLVIAAVYALSTLPAMVGIPHWLPEGAVWIGTSQYRVVANSVRDCHLATLAAAVIWNNVPQSFAPLLKITACRQASKTYIKIIYQSIPCWFFKVTLMGVVGAFCFCSNESLFVPKFLPLSVEG